MCNFKVDLEFSDSPLHLHIALGEAGAEGPSAHQLLLY